MDKLFQIRNRYRTGDIAVYPLLIQHSTNPDAGRIKLVSAKKVGKWVEMDHYGDTPLNSWEDVFEFLEQEIKKLIKLNALSYIGVDQVREYWIELNPRPEIINAPDVDDIENLTISEAGISPLWRLYDMDEDSPRYEKGYWELILSAWNNSLEMIKEDYLADKLVELN